MCHSLNLILLVRHVVLYCIYFSRTTSLPNFLGTFVQPNLTTTNIINNNNTNINNNNKPTIAVVQTPSGFHKVADDDKVDIPMVVDDVKLQQQSAVNLPSQLQQLVERVVKSPSENRHQDTLENNNLSPKQEDVKPPSPSSSPYIDINSLPMVFDDTKLFQNVSRDYNILNSHIRSEPAIGNPPPQFSRRVSVI